MEEMLNYVVQNGFAISVAVYLLYERSKINVEVANALVKVSGSIERIEEMLRRSEK